MKEGMVPDDWPNANVAPIFRLSQVITDTKSELYSLQINGVHKQRRPYEPHIIWQLIKSLIKKIHIKKPPSIC